MQLGRNNARRRSGRSIAVVRGAACAAVLAALALGASGAADASNGWKKGSGTLVTNLSIVSVTQSGTDTIVELAGGGEWTGTLQGAFTTAATNVVHADGTADAVGVNDIASAVLGDCGPIGAVHLTSVTHAVAQPDGSFVYEGHQTLNGGKRGLQIEIVYGGVLAPDGTTTAPTYSMRYRCARD